MPMMKDSIGFYCIALVIGLAAIILLSLESAGRGVF